MDYFSAFNNWCTGVGLWHGGASMSSWGSWMPFHFSGIFQLLIIGLIIYFTVRLFRSPTTNNGPDTAENVLRRRFAAGEIDEKTYRSMKDELRTK